MTQVKYLINSRRGNEVVDSNMTVREYLNSKGADANVGIVYFDGVPTNDIDAAIGELTSEDSCEISHIVKMANA